MKIKSKEKPSKAATKDGVYPKSKTRQTTLGRSKGHMTKSLKKTPFSRQKFNYGQTHVGESFKGTMVRFRLKSPRFTEFGNTIQNQEEQP